MKTRNAFYFFTLIAFLTFVFGSTAIVKAASQAKPIKVAHIGVTSGPFSSLGMGGKQAMMVWEEVVNKKGGVLGRSVKVLYYDSKARPAIAIEMLKKAVYNDEVDFIISTDSSGVVLASYPIMKELKKVYISGTGAAEAMQDTVNRYCFHAGHSSRTYGYAMAKLLLEKYPNIKTVIGVNPDYAWGRACWGSFTEAFKKLQPEAKFPLELWPPFGVLDFKPYISQIVALKNLNQAALHTSLWAGDQVTFDKQGKAFGLFKKVGVFLDNSSTNLAVHQALRPDGVKGWGSSHYSYIYDSPSNKEFVKEFQTMFGKKDLPTSSAGGTCRAGQLLEAAIEKAGNTDTLPVIKALEGLRLKDTVSGPAHVREWDHINITDMVLGWISPDPYYPFWTWKDPFIVKAAEVQEIIPEKRYKGWRGNQ